MLKKITEEDGVLVPIEFSDLPFAPQRIFYVKDVPKGEERGNHAHYETQQLLICVQGEILVKVHDGTKLNETILTPEEFILIPKMAWDSQVFLTGNDILVAICSTPYNIDDYILDFEQFKELANEKQ